MKSQEQIIQNNRLQTNYPRPPTYDEKCASNVTYETLTPRTAEGGYTPYRDGIFGPLSLKKLYTGPWCYPPQYTRRPNDILYGFNTSTRYNNGNIHSYGVMLYPFHHRSPSEVRPYANPAPLPDIFEWTQHPVVMDGAWNR
jgi:hypothetical protein